MLVNDTQGVFSYQHFRITECHADEECTGDSDTCVSQTCKCGSIGKCSGRTDTCVNGYCKCGENDECTDTEYCSLGECRRMRFLLFKVFSTINYFIS